MTGTNDLQRQTAKLLASVAPGAGQESRQLKELEELLVRARVGAVGGETLPRALSVERATWYSADNLELKQRQRIERLVGRLDPDEGGQYLAFRREAAIAAPALDLAVPSWGRGAAARTVGPFTAQDGRQFWFDFFPLVRLVPLYLAGDNRPALLFHVSQLRLRPGDTIPIAEVLGLLSRAYRLAPGSFWIRADLLAPGSPSGSYVGLQIRGGRLRLTPPPLDVGGKLTIPASGSCSVTLDLAPPAPVAAGSGPAGADAADAELALPSTFSFTLTAGGAKVTELGRASWRLFDQSIEFAWEPASPPTYEAGLHSVLISLRASSANLIVQQSRSPFAEVNQQAPIHRAAWALQVATIDVASPPEAAGSGGLAVQLSAGMTLGWRGLRAGPVRLPAPWVALWPGMLLIADSKASNRYAHQRFHLWKDVDSKFRSSLEVRCTDAFAVVYVAAAGGTEQLLAIVNAEARIDRPVDVKGTPLPVHTLNSSLLLTYTDTQQWAFFYEDNILTDSLDPQASWPVKPGEAISLAIRNALFTITPVNSLFLFAQLRDEEMVERGTLLLGMGLYGLLPTLPDPYAANVGWLRRSIRGEQQMRRASVLLVAAVAWTLADDDLPDDVATRFAFAPLGTQDDTMEAWTRNTLHSESINSVRGVWETQAAVTTPSVDNYGTLSAPARAAAIANRGSNQADWDRHFAAFEREQFALLDVSSNADQMGVSFAWFDARKVDDSRHSFQSAPSDTRAAIGAYPLQIEGLDLSAQSRYVRAFTVPQISWEPLVNITPPVIGGDPPFGFNLYPNDGGPTRLFNDSAAMVPIAPIPVTDLLVKDFDTRSTGFTGALFTLPFGLRSFAEFSRQNQFVAGLDAAKLGFNRPAYDAAGLRGGLQLRADAPKHPSESPIFKGSTLQLNNVARPDGAPAFAGTLGSSVGEIFNEEFFYDGSTGYKNRGVPVTRIDFSGYGASLFSHWQNPNAAIAATSQAFFDVFIGRTAHEVIQVRSLVYPWGIRVVRTISIFRVSSSYVFRIDTGWQAESDGIYDFRYTPYDTSHKPLPAPLPSPYEVHPGIVKGVFQIRNIRETNAVPNFKAVWNKAIGETYVDNDNILRTVTALTPPNESSPPVNLQPVYFDADVEIVDVISGAANGRVTSKGMLGYVQLAPRGEPLSKALFKQLLTSQFGSLGGEVECGINVAQSGQQMRVGRVDVNASEDAVGQPIFVSAARGAVVLPKDGAWSVVQHLQGNGDVTPLAAQATVPLIRRGRLNVVTGITDATGNDLFRLADPIDVVRAPVAATRNYALLQSTGTQKALFRLPSFKTGLDQLLGAAPDFADAYRIVNSVGIFPNVQDALPLSLGLFKTTILPEGYRLLDAADPDKVFEQVLPPGPLYLINEEFLKIYVEYAKKDKNGTTQAAGKLRYGFNAAAADLGKKWLSKVNDIGMVVDLGPMKRLMMIKGKFNAEKGATPGFIEPELEFSEALQPVIDILQILMQLQGGDYKEALKKGLEVAMSNSADSWAYSFHARKEIPVVRFPPGVLYSSPTNPLKLEAHLAIGVYFNEAMSVPTSPGQLIPSAGAFLEFGGSLSVMCVSLALGTVYANGAVDLRMSGDIKTGPALYMKFGFGAEIVVGIPVVGSVSVLYMVGVEINLTTTELTVAGFLLFRGRAELIGGLVTVTILIEAKGAVKRLSAPDRTDLIAQVTFGLDISIFLVINISFSQSWQESRQIA
jgi:hypothetical protein